MKCVCGDGKYVDDDVKCDGIGINVKRADVMLKCSCDYEA